MRPGKQRGRRRRRRGQQEPPHGRHPPRAASTRGAVRRTAGIVGTVALAAAAAAAILDRGRTVAPPPPPQLQQRTYPRPPNATHPPPATAAAAAAATAAPTTTTRATLLSSGTENQEQQRQRDNNGTQYLYYLSHGGFSNQLLALKHAIQLAYATNRTLVVPPVLPHKDRFSKVATTDGGADRKRLPPAPDPSATRYQPRNCHFVHTECLDPGAPSVRRTINGKTIDRADVPHGGALREGGAEYRRMMQRIRSVHRTGYQFAVNDARLARTVDPRDYPSLFDLIDFRHLTQTTGARFVDLIDFVEKYRGLEPERDALPYVPLRFDLRGPCTLGKRRHYNNLVKQFRKHYGNDRVVYVGSGFMLHHKFRHYDPRADDRISRSVVAFRPSPKLMRIVRAVYRELMRRTRQQPYLGIHIRTGDGVTMDNCTDFETYYQEHIFSYLNERMAMTAAANDGGGGRRRPNEERYFDTETTDPAQSTRFRAAASNTTLWLYNNDDDGRPDGDDRGSDDRADAATTAARPATVHERRLHVTYETPIFVGSNVRKAKQCFEELSDHRYKHVSDLNDLLDKLQEQEQQQQQQQQMQHQQNSNSREPKQAVAIGDEERIGTSNSRSAIRTMIDSIRGETGTTYLVLDGILLSLGVEALLAKFKIPGYNIPGSTFRRTIRYRHRRRRYLLQQIVQEEQQQQQQQQQQQ